MSVLSFRKKRPRDRVARRHVARQRRHARVLKKIRGTAERPRLVVRRSLRHIHAQLVDDDRGICITGVSTRLDDVKAKLKKGERDKSAQGHAAGLMMAERARSKGIERIVFDRGGHRYHGRVKAFADGAREGGLEF